MDVLTRCIHIANRSVRPIRWIGGVVLLWVLVGGAVVSHAQSSKVLVESNVAGATIEVDGQTRGQTNAEGEALLQGLEAGVYTIKLRKSGYWSASSRVTLESGLTTTVELSLSERPSGEAGRLMLRTNVTDALVTVDGREVGRTGPEGEHTVSGMTLGTHRVVVQKEGYDQAAQTINFKEQGLDQSIQLRLDPKRPAMAENTVPLSDSVASESTRTDTEQETKARFVVDAGVPGAEVVIEDSIWGRTDVNGLFATRTEPGTYRVSVRKDGYKASQQTVQVDAGGPHSMAFKLDPVSSSESARLLVQLQDNVLLLVFGSIIGLAGLVLAFLSISGGNKPFIRWPWKREKFDRYDVMAVLQRSEFSTVYLANDPDEHGKATLTVLDDPYAGDPDHAKPFLRRGYMLQKIRKTNPEAPVLRVHEVGREGGTQEGRPFILFEHLDGETLLSHLKSTDTLDTQTSLSIVRQICTGLQAAHENDVHHGSVNPENVIMTETSPQVKVKLIGFGLQGYSNPRQAIGEDLGSGNSAYVAPEQLRNGEGDWRADMYAVGMLFYKLVRGTPPHASDSRSQVLRQQEEDPQPELPDQVPEHVKPLFYRMISKDPSQRPDAARVVSVLDLLHSTA